MPAIALKRHDERTRKLKLLPHPGYALVLNEVAKGTSVKGACRRLRRRGVHAPSPARFFAWALQSQERYDLFTRAIEAKTEAHVDALEDLLEGAFVDETGKRIEDPAMLAVRLRAAEAAVKLRQWRAAKVMPRRYGDKLQHEHSGSLSVTVATGVDLLGAAPQRRIVASLDDDLDGVTDAQYRVLGDAASPAAAPMRAAFDALD